MDKLQKTTTQYIQSLSKRQIGEDREKILPVGRLGQIYANHGDDFEPDSQFGNCLIAFGRTNEKIARHQETFTSTATNNWLEGLERSLAQMKEFQAARKKLEARRLAYDASLAKVSKARRDDFRVEEELRAQKAKYEESSEDVFRRMWDIKDAEEESVAELTQFVDAQLEYYDRCREELLRCKREWPAAPKQTNGQTPRGGRARSNTAHSYNQRFEEEQAAEHPALPTRPSIRSASNTSRNPSSSRGPPPTSYNEPGYSQHSPPRPNFSRSHTVTSATPTPPRRDLTSSGADHAYDRKPSFASEAQNMRGMLRPTVSRVNTSQSGDVFADGGPSDESLSNSATSYAGEGFDRSPGGSKRSVSPATSYGGNGLSRQSSAMDLERDGGAGGQAVGKRPPPPPPSRSKKPAPPPPMKRS